MVDGILDHLIELYGDANGRSTYTRLVAMLDKYQSLAPAQGFHHAGLTEKDVLLITYPNQVLAPEVAPLRSLAEFCKRHLRGVINRIHVLPFFPSSSDDGFSVMDYTSVDPHLGSWQDILAIKHSFQLMVDAVINHVSSESVWFQKFLSGDPKYQNFFISVDDTPDLGMVVRPRDLPLLTHFTVLGKQKAIWTTFSADQIDLNYHNPQVLLKIIKVILDYVTHGADFIRLDAIAYLWKEIGTPCIHLSQTHRIVQLLRSVLDQVAPHVYLITETNVPHQENISYFGNGVNEAQLVYNFALPPLVLHSLQTGSARKLTQWAASLKLPSRQATYLNFLASHDGIGLNPVRGILTDSEIEALVEKTHLHGGLVSYKRNTDGSSGPYELNINYFDALSSPLAKEHIATAIDRFMTAQAIMLSIIGVPGIYFHSLFGSRGWPEGVRLTGKNRMINRQKLDCAETERDLGDPSSLRYWVSKRYFQLLIARTGSSVFHPYGEQEILDCGPRVFGVLRYDPQSESRILCLHNVSARKQRVPIPIKNVFVNSTQVVDVITGIPEVQPRNEVIQLQPYQTLWLQGVNF